MKKIDYPKENNSDEYVYTNGNHKTIRMMRLIVLQMQIRVMNHKELQVAQSLLKINKEKKEEIVF